MDNGRGNVFVDTNDTKRKYLGEDEIF